MEGPYPSMDPETVISVDAVNAVCVGEGEDAVCELVESLEAGRDYTQIKNLWVKDANGNIARNRLRPFTDLTKLPPEDKELFDLKKILPLKNFQLETMLSRGCIYKCTYCINDSYVKQYKKLSDVPVSLKSYTRIKNIDTAVTEIKSVVSKFPEIKKVAFIDDNFMIYTSFIEEFCQKYKEEIGLPFMCNINPMSFDLSKVKLLKDAGCNDIRFGIESGSERIKKK